MCSTSPERSYRSEHMSVCLCVCVSRPSVSPWSRPCPRSPRRRVPESRSASCGSGRPAGQFLERRFLGSCKLQVLFDFVASKGFPWDEFKLLTTFPRRNVSCSPYCALTPSPWARPEPRSECKMSARFVSVVHISVHLLATQQTIGQRGLEPHHYHPLRRNVQHCNYCHFNIFCDRISLGSSPLGAYFSW